MWYDDDFILKNTKVTGGGDVFDGNGGGGFNSGTYDGGRREFDGGVGGFRGGGEAFCRLTSACPVLEDLLFDGVTTGFCFDSPSLFTISVPSLHRLEIKDNTSRARYSYSSYKSRFKLNTPSLKHLNLSMENFAGSFELYEDMPDLVEARLGVDPTHTRKFLTFLTSVEFLSIHICAPKVTPVGDF
ncbi:hypothetical protein Bca52824_036054 [Brassica carinata]|uniref:Uncharacterized protein n=1 Tax=Brassica carinata TaxID=52824 RepID=A0A8X7V2D4_BRACI|nr:hypothetical protein Bca52824_036054 [Brassica carinata]